MRPSASPSNPSRKNPETTERAHPGLGLIGLTVAGLAAAALLGCRSQSEPAKAPERAVDIPLVEAVAARRGAFPLVHRVSGVVRAQNQVEMRPEIAAVLAEVLVKSGDPVEKGQPLVRLEPDLHRQALREGQASVQLALAEAAAARARVAELEAQASRTRKLAEQAIVSAWSARPWRRSSPPPRPACSRRRPGPGEARASLGGRRSTLDKTVVRSPIAGRVGRRDRGRHAGHAVPPSCSSWATSRVIVDLPITERMLAQMKPASPLQIAGAALGDRTIAAPCRASPRFSRPAASPPPPRWSSTTPTSGCCPACSSPPTSPTGDRPATLVPTSALWEDPRTGLLGVYVVDRPRRRPGPDSASRPGCAPAGDDPGRGTGHRRRRGARGGRLVVTIGQHLLAAAEGTSARVRLADWDQVLALQARQQEDLLARFLEKQRRLARTLGAEPPGTDTILGARPTEAVKAGGQADPRPRARARHPLSRRHGLFTQPLAAASGGHLDGLPHPDGGGRRLLAQLARRPAAQGRVHPAHRARALPQRRSPGDRADHHQPDRERGGGPAQPRSGSARSPRRG